MTLTRRSLLAAASALPVVGAARTQEAWPSRPVRFIVPFPPGGSTDVLSRVIAERLAGELGQPVVIENRAGAAGNVGVDAVAKARPDGYTIGISTIGPLATHSALYRTLPFNPATDFTLLADLYEITNVFVVNPSTNIRTVADFIAAAQARPGQLTFGTPGNGTTAHLSTEYFARRVGIELTHVPYRTGAMAVQDLIAGRIDMMFDNLPTITGQIQGGQIRPIGVSTAQRWPGLPDVPTMIEQGIADFDVTSWSGLIAPKDLPAPIAQRITAAMLKVGADPAFQARFIEMGARATVGPPEQLQRRIAMEAPRWAEVVRASGARID
jgi:tripartite-type tricarboxylate transporter receptor subunit TctC